MRIVLWAPLPPPLGGIGVWTQDYLRNAHLADLSVQLIDTSPGGERGKGQSQFVASRSLLALSRLRELDRALESRPVAAHLTTTWFWAAAREAIALALCRRAQVPTLLHVRRGTALLVWLRQLRRPVRQALLASLRQASAIAVLTPELEVWLQDALPSVPILRLPQAVDTLRFQPVAIAVPSPCLRVLFVGLQCAAKGLPELAAAILQTSDTELIVAGPPADAPCADLLALAQAGRLRQLGPVPPAAMAEVYQAADVFCLPSRDEGMPRTLLEAMACALPCVATPVGGVAEAVGDAALLAPIGDVAALAQALARLRDDAALRARLGAAAVALVQERHSMAAVLRIYAGVYAGLRVGAVTQHHPSGSGPRPG